MLFRQRPFAQYKSRALARHDDADVATTQAEILARIHDTAHSQVPDAFDAAMSNLEARQATERNGRNTGM